MILILFGDGCVATFALYTKLGGVATPFANDWAVIIFGWGFAVMLGIYVAGAISGAHINPAVTFGMAVTGRLPWGKVLPYWLAQVLGAFVAGGILWFVYQGALQNTIAGGSVNLTIGGVFYTSPKAFVGTFGAFGDEFLGTALLLFMILSIVDARNQPVQGNLNPLIIGFLIVAIGASFGLNTGYAINPARDFGPRLWIALFSGGRKLYPEQLLLLDPHRRTTVRRCCWSLGLRLDPRQGAGGEDVRGLWRYRDNRGSCTGGLSHH